MISTMAGDRIVICNSTDELRRMTRWLWDGAAASGIPDDIASKLDLCANEAVMNIISYAYPDAGRREITLELNETPDGVSLVIRDDGKPFNPLDVPEPKLPKSLDEALIGGLGVHFIRRMMTRFEYQRADGFNVLSFEVRRDRPVGNA